MNFLLDDYVSKCCSKGLCCSICSAIPVLVGTHYSKSRDICVSALEVVQNQPSVQSW